MARAIAHGATKVARFSDPTAMALLPDDARGRVERIRSGARPRGLRDRVDRRILLRLSSMMVARTVEIDDAIREAASPQVVILGAGLDGRAWRMRELRDVVVFEVDHPDSQRDKRARAASLTPITRDLRFVPVDFERDRLDQALTTAGHDPSLPTTWLWEGVVIYLALRDIEATLSDVERRSAPKSRLCLTYHSPAAMLRLVGLAVRRMGEPLRSSFPPDVMRGLLARYGFMVKRDRDLATIGASLPVDLGEAIRFLTHVRVGTADKPAAP
jgi:methyltransferase (TIGR00027 family)